MKRRKKKFLDVTLNESGYGQSGETVSGLYTRDLVAEEQEEPYSRNRNWSITDAFSFKKNNSYEGDIDDFFHASNGPGKYHTPEPHRTEENLIIENIINECMRESMRAKKSPKESKMAAEQERKQQSVRSGELETSFEESRRGGKSSKRVSRSTTLPSNDNRNKSSFDSEDCRETVPRESRKTPKNATKRSQSSDKGRPRNLGNSRGDVNNGNVYSNESNVKRRESPHKLLGYLERADQQNPKSSKKSLRSDCDNNSEHGSSYSAFALVPGTELQRKLSQRGINDKVSLNIIKDSVNVENKQRQRNVRSAVDLRHEHNRQSFHSVDNIFASSVASRQEDRYSSSKITSQLQSSFSADDIIDECMFKPLKSPQQQHNAAAPAIFAVTSTPRDTSCENTRDQEEGFATYV